MTSVILPFLSVLLVQSSATQLLEDLGSDRVEIRDRVESKLMALGPTAEKALQLATKSRDQEVVARVRGILDRVAAVKRDSDLYLRYEGRKSLRQDGVDGSGESTNQVIAWSTRRKLARDWRVLFPTMPDPARAYGLANEHFNAGRFEKAKNYCELAIEKDPLHAEAKALLLEIAFILGTPRVGSDGRYALQANVMRYDSVLVEMDNQLVRSTKALEEGKPITAEKQARLVLEYAKWLPEGVEVTPRVEKARALLTKILKR